MCTTKATALLGSWETFTMLIQVIISENIEFVLLGGVICVERIFGYINRKIKVNANKI